MLRPFSRRPSVGGRASAFLGLTAATLMTACAGGGPVDEGTSSTIADTQQEAKDAGCAAASDCPEPDDICLKASCDAGKCATANADGRPCHDDEICTVNDVCKGGKCSAGIDLCQCHADGDCASQEDGNLCNGTLFCDKAKPPYRCAVNPTTVVTCDGSKDTPCSLSKCSPSTGKYAPAAAPDGTLCDDGKACTVDSSCKSGKCVGGTGTFCGCTENKDCDHLNDNLCLGAWCCDKTLPSSCKFNPAKAVQCDDSKDTACAVNACDPKVGKCTLTPLKDGTPCDDGDPKSLSDACEKGQCKGTSTFFCTTDDDCKPWEDGDLCNGTLFCDESAKTCAVNPSTKKSCPSANDSACLVNTCDKATGGCVMTPQPNGTACDDGDKCTAGDICLFAACSAGQFTCTCKTDADCKDSDDGNVCNGVFFCNQATKKCTHNPSSITLCPTVDDTACQKNACDPKDGKCTQTATANTRKRCDVPPDLSNEPCRFEVMGANDKPLVFVACSDGDPCTASDQCDGKACKSGKKTCACQNDADCPDLDGDVCTGTSYCDKTGALAACKPNPASVITCSKKDDWKCEERKCHPNTGLCQLQPVNDGAKCDDGKPCTISEACKSGACAAGGVNGCNDGNACTEDKCVPGSGCQHKAVVCDDGNVCTVEACDKVSGQCSKPAPVKEGALCNADDDPCTAGDACLGGLCKTGTPVQCSDGGNPCQVSTCKAQSAVSFSCVAVPKKDGTLCPEGDQGCWYGAACKAGKCGNPTKSRYGLRLVGDTAGDLELNDVKLLGDGFIAVGRRSHLSGGNVTYRSWWAQRYDKNANPVWAKPWEWAATPNKKAASVTAPRGANAVSAIGGIFLAGTTIKSDGIHQPTIVELNADGTLKKATHTYLYSSSDHSFATAYDRRDGGSSVICGATQWGSSLTGARLAIAYVDSAGVVKVRRRASAVSGSDVCAAVKAMDDGGAITVDFGHGPWFGYTTKRAIGTMTRWSNSGDIVWEVGAGNLASGATARGSASIAIVNNAARAFTGREFAGSGQTTVTQALLNGGFQFSGTFAGSLGAAAHGTLFTVLAGSSAKPHFPQMAVVDQSGNLLQTVTHTGAGIQEGHYRAVVRLEDGTNVAVGYAKTKSGQQGLVGLSAPWGHAGCAHVGKCAGLALKQCDDGKRCTRDRCLPSVGCVHDPATGFRCDASGACAKSAECDGDQCKDNKQGNLYQYLASFSTSGHALFKGPGDVVHYGGMYSTPGRTASWSLAGGVIGSADCGLLHDTGAVPDGTAFIFYGRDSLNRARFCRPYSMATSLKTTYVFGTGNPVATPFGAARNSDNALWFGYRGSFQDKDDVKLVWYSGVNGKQGFDSLVVLYELRANTTRDQHGLAHGAKIEADPSTPRIPGSSFAKPDTNAGSAARR